MKRITAIIICALILITALSGCAEIEKTDKLSVVCTVFPQYDWVREIIGDEAENVDITLLLNSGVDVHSYQPTAGDMIKISSCDVFIFTGGESEHWAEKALLDAVNKDMRVVNLMEVLGDGAKLEQTVEGMEPEEEGEEEEEEFDEHMWLSVKNAALFCREIANVLKTADSKNADIYEENVKNYITRINDLDARYKATVDNSAVKTMVFGDRFPFMYLADDYGISYYAAFRGCSAETEASFETVMFLAGKVDELGLKYVFAIEGAQHRIAQTVIENTNDKNQLVLTLDSMQLVTDEGINAGKTYLSIMEDNLRIIEVGLK